MIAAAITQAASFSHSGLANAHLVAVAGEGDERHDGERQLRLRITWLRTSSGRVPLSP